MLACVWAVNGARDVGAADLAAVARGASSGGAPPAISPIADQTTPEGQSVGPVPFTIADQDTPSTQLVVAVSSSDDGLLPTANTAVHGSGEDRTVTSRPVPGRTGTATITIQVSDGTSIASVSFAVAVTSIVGPGQLRLVEELRIDAEHTTIAIGSGQPSRAHIAVSSAAAWVALDLGNRLGSCTGGRRLATLPTALTVTVDHADLRLETPAPLVVAGPCAWDGTFVLYEALLLPASTARSVSGGPRVVGGPSSAVVVGSTAVDLDTDRAVRVLKRTDGGQPVSLARRDGAQDMVTTCAGDCQELADDVPVGRACRLDLTVPGGSSAGDLVVWTKALGVILTTRTRCAPRPQVELTTTRSGGMLRVRIQSKSSVAISPLRELRFEQGTNAWVTLGNGQTFVGTQTVAFPPDTLEATLSVERVATGRPLHVPLTIVDACGEWKTFVGAGSSAGF